MTVNDEACLSSVIRRRARNRKLRRRVEVNDDTRRRDCGAGASSELPSVAKALMQINSGQPRGLWYEMSVHTGE